MDDNIKLEDISPVKFHKDPVSNANGSLLNFEDKGDPITNGNVNYDVTTTNTINDTTGEVENQEALENDETYIVKEEDKPTGIEDINGDVMMTEDENTNEKDIGTSNDNVDQNNEENKDKIEDENAENDIEVDDEEMENVNNKVNGDTTDLIVDEKNDVDVPVEEEDEDDDGVEDYVDDDDNIEGGDANTVINGRGIWNSWTRNFSTPLLALLDLLDNAFDAASLVQAGRIYITPDTYAQQGSRGGMPRTTGLTLWNNSITPIKPLQKVLEVYTSLKGSHANSIGENGVGLKQGCATLSNLSFCVVKSNEQYSMGVIAYQLQTNQGCSLPSFTFDSTNMDDLRNEMVEKFTNESPAVGDCIMQYGAMDGLQVNDNPSLKPLRLKVGIDRIIEKFEYMNKFGWENHDHVFGLIVDNLKHGEKTLKGKSKSGQDLNIMDQQIRVNKLFETLYQDLPKRYLHIPTFLDVRVGGQIVNFNFWQPRLVEMAQFDLTIHTTMNMMDVISARKENSEKKSKPDVDDQNGKAKVNGVKNDNNESYVLRCYTGFDALRVCDDRAQKTAAMYIYSRQSGRLIKANADCRGELGLTSGGTDFCQGLTLIVDDFNANFPLNPTKQDVAFGEQSNGETHKRNLYIWLNACTRLYYMFYKDRVCNKQKRILTESLRALEPKVKQLIAQSSTTFQSLSDCQFTTFGEYTSNFLINNGQVIRLLPFRTIEYIIGKDSRLQLPPVPENELDLEPIKSTKNNKRNSTGSKKFISSLAADYDDEDEDDEDFEIALQKAYDECNKKGKNSKKDSSPKSQARRRHLKNEEYDYDDDDDIPDAVGSASRKRSRKSSISESKYSESSLKNDKRSNDVGYLHTKIRALEEENRQLKRDLHQDRYLSEDVVVKKNQQIEQFRIENSKLRKELTQHKQQLKTLKLQSSGNGTTLPDDLSSLNTSGDAKTAKRLKNLKSNIDLMKAENDDLKEQIKGLEATIQRKEKTIQAQRKLIDQRNEEDESDDDVESESGV